MSSRRLPPASRVLYIDGKTGFTSPTWDGYVSVRMRAANDPAVRARLAKMAAANGISVEEQALRLLEKHAGR